MGTVQRREPEPLSADTLNPNVSICMRGLVSRLGEQPRRPAPCPG